MSFSGHVASEEIVNAVEASVEELENDLSLGAVNGSSRYVEPVMFDAAVLGLAISQPSSAAFGWRYDWLSFTLAFGVYFFDALANGRMTGRSGVLGGSGGGRSISPEIL